MGQPAAELRTLRRYAIARSLFSPTTLEDAVERMGFVQADPIRAPARAQDLTLRHRVGGYVAGDLERRYPDLQLEEDYFVNYGFLPRRHLALMHPRQPRSAWSASTKKRAAAVLAFVEQRGEAHPRVVEEHFGHGTTKNWFDGSSNVTTQLLHGMHYRGMVRVARRQGGIRVYAPRQPAFERRATHEADAEALFALAVAKYAPVPLGKLGWLASGLRVCAPQLYRETRAALARAKRTLPRTSAAGLEWVWPEAEDELRRSASVDERVRFLAPFDPVVWDRLRFEAFWGWTYRFEAYTPKKKRKLGYYALPLLWREQVIGWGNLAVDGAALHADVGYASGRAPRDRTFARELDAELERVRAFLNLGKVGRSKTPE